MNTNPLSELYANVHMPGQNPHCEGCSILNSSKPAHSILDYETLAESDVLFLSDSFRFRLGSHQAFSDVERELLTECLGEPAAFSAAVKCPSVKEADMSPANMKLCRKHLEDTVDAVKPKLIMPCGNLAMKMLIKKSGINTKRGKSFTYETEKGHVCTVVPIFHPYSVIKEPRHRHLFDIDIKNAWDKYISPIKKVSSFKFEITNNIDEVRSICKTLSEIEEPIACDIETTGLNFLTDSIMSIAFATSEGNWVIPCYHKDSSLSNDEAVEALTVHIKNVLENPKNEKVFHNAKFDLKFLMKFGINTVNVRDTKIMHHLVDENLPKSLMDLVKLYFADELESL